MLNVRARRNVLNLLLTAPFILSIGCKRKRKWATPEPLTEQAFPTAITFSSATSGAQFLTGFYPVEDSWRWTKKDFSVVLGRPAATAGKRTDIALTFNVPDAIIQKLKSITLYASINGHNLSSATYTNPGDYSYVQEVPPASLASEKVSVDFHLDKALPPTAGDPRELGIVVSAVRLKSN
jgi:hypothetical protein